MAKETQSLFRKKSLDRISSPEQLNEYIRVSTPSVWMLLTAIVVLLAGVCVWGVFGRMESTLSVAAVSRENAVTAYVREADIDRVKAEAVVKVDDETVGILAIDQYPVQVDVTFPEYACHVGGLQQGEWVYPVVLDASYPEGVYAVQIVVDSVSPMSFVLN